MDIKTMAGLIKKHPSPISELTRLAQAVHETGNFTSNIFKNANNAFGIKASAPWTGASFNAKTGEHQDGKDVIVRDNFREYPDVEDSVKDQAAFFTSTKHRETVAYKEAIEAPTYKEEVFALMGPGRYATDVPSNTSIGYAQKLLNTIKNYNLKSYGMSETGTLKEEIKLTSPVPKLRTQKQKFTLINRFPNQNKPQWAVVHYVGAAGQARANADYFYNVDRQSSAHAFEDPNDAYAVVREQDGAWHVGDGAYSKQGSANGYVRTGATNWNSLGIEMCLVPQAGVPIVDWQPHPYTVLQTVLRVADWMKRYKFGMDRVIRHYDASGKMCPACWRHNDWAKWWEFRKILKHYHETGELLASALIGTSKTLSPDEVKDIPVQVVPIQPQTPQNILSTYVDVEQFDKIDGNRVGVTKAETMILFGEIEETDTGFWVGYEAGDKTYKWMKIADVVEGKIKNLKAAITNSLYTEVKKENQPAAKQTVHLPKVDPKWAVYKVGSSYTLGTQVGHLAPAQYGGLTYDIIKWLIPNQVAQIKTESFGEVAIYIASGTGAVIK